MPETAHLYLAIEGKYYRVERMPPEGEKMPHGWRLRPVEDPEAKGPYAVLQHRTGVLTCDCASWTFDKSKTHDYCKHQTALIAVGLLKGRSQ